MKPKHQHFPLSTSALCQDCECVGDNLRECAACGSHSLVALAPLLNPCDDPTISPERVRRLIDALEEGLKQ